MSSSEEENFDEGEEEEVLSNEEDDEEDARPSKKSRANEFIEMEAEVDEDDDEDEDDDALGEGDLIDDTIERDEAAASRHHRRTFRPDESERHDLLDELAKKYEQREGEAYVDDDDDDDAEDLEAIGAVDKQALLPTVTDPKLWCIKCKSGQERAIVITIMKKWADSLESGEPLSIKSAIASDNFRGYVYVEAFKEIHVKKAIEDVPSVFRFQVKLVPMKEMTDVLNVQKKHVLLTAGQWVRMKRGTYNGDIAQVVDANPRGSQDHCQVKLIPRIDYSVLGGKGPDDNKRKRTKRPPAKLFSPQEIQAAGGNTEFHIRHDCYLFNGDRYKDGYLLKEVSIKSLIVDGVMPTLDEIQKFQDTKEGDEKPSASALMPPPSLIGGPAKTKFVKGDTVKVVTGDLKHLTGVVELVEGELITVKPKHEDLHESIKFPATQLEKFFKLGDHGKVIAGRYQGETGLITKVDDDTVTLFSDLTSQEIEVFARDVQESTQVASGLDAIGNYELHDLVEIDRNTMGVIVKVEMDSFQILDNNGKLHRVKVQEIGRKRSSRNAVALDANQNQISVADVVRLNNPPHKGKQATVKHLYRSFAFLHSRDIYENGGIFVTRTRGCVVMGAKSSNSSSSFLPPQSPRLSSPGRNDWNPAQQLRDQQRGAQGAQQQRHNFGAYNRGGQDEWLHKTVVIKLGPWKGYMGTVKDTTHDSARVELHSKCKTVTVPKTSLNEHGKSSTSRPVDNNRGGSEWDKEDEYSRDNTAGSRTPMYDAMRTPMHESVGTPYDGADSAWNPTTPRSPGREDRSGGMGTAWTPHTPQTSATPNTFDPYSPAPGGYGDSAATPSADTPYDSATPSFNQTPGTSYQDPYTPHTPHTPNSPATPGYDSRSPYAAAATPGFPQTPGTSLPGTPAPGPGTPLDMDPGTPAPAAEDPWYTTDIEVKIQSNTFEGGAYSNCNGIIREVNADATCSVDVPSKKETITINAQYLEPIVPQNKDTVKILKGEYRDQHGHLIGIDGSDGIVKMDNRNRDIKIMNMSDLAKYVPP